MWRMIYQSTLHSMKSQSHKNQLGPQENQSATAAMKKFPCGKKPEAALLSGVGGQTRLQVLGERKTHQILRPVSTA